MKKIFIVIVTLLFLCCATVPKNKDVFVGLQIFTYENWSFDGKDPNGNGEVRILYFDNVEDMNGYISVRIKNPLLIFTDENANKNEINRLQILGAALTFDEPSYSSGRKTNIEWFEVKQTVGQLTRFYVRATYWNEDSWPRKPINQREFFWLEH